MIKIQIALALVLAALAVPGVEVRSVSAPPVALVQEPELQDGDLLVGVHDGRGAIVRIRAGVATRYCISQDNHGEPMYFDTPKEVVIDSRGDVVFLAFMSTPAAPASLGPYGLWRCSAMGAPPELIGAFGTKPEFDHPRPLGDRPVKWAGGLHIKRASGVNLDTGTATTTEWYVFIVTDSGDGHRDTIAYNPALNTWADTGVMEDPLQPAPAAGYFQFDMINGGSGPFNYTVSAAGNAMKVVAEPISLEVEWAGVLTAKLAFQSVRELVGAVVDDLSVGNADGHDCLSPYPGTPRNAFGTINGMAGINALAWPGTLLMQSDSFGMGHPFVPLQDLALFNLDPSDDASALYTWPLDCSVRPKLLFNPWHPFNSYNDASGLPRSVDVLAPGGTAGTQRFDGRVIGIGPSQNVVVLAEGLNAAPYVNPTGIDVYPGYKPNVAGQSLFVRIDSPVNVLITDAGGRRIGIDASGNAVNDFGAAGYDSETDEPRIVGIRQPTSGSYRVETAGTGSGPFHVKVFGVDHATLDVSHAAFAGQAAPGSQSSHEFAVDEGGRVSSESEGDHEPPVIEATRTPANAYGWNSTDVIVTFACSDAASAVTISPGSSITVSAEGPGQSASATCVDAAGNEARATVTDINIDRTEPILSAARSPEANAHGWNNTSVTVSFSCDDGLSGVDAESVSGPTTITEEGADQSVSASCSDRAGNTASLNMAGINIDKTPPLITCSTDPLSLWPPNRRMAAVNAIVDVFDAGSGPAGFILAAAASNEAAGDMEGWQIGTPDVAGAMRAWRLGSGVGRIYTLTYRGIDRAGNTGACAATVAVPHDRRP